MTHRHRRSIVVVTVLLFTLVPTMPALADHLTIETSVPDSVRAGDIVEMRAVVRSAETGERVPGAEVVVFREAEFLGVSGQIELARAVADDRGIVVLRFEIRAGTSEQILVASAMLGDQALESHPVPVITIGEGPQIVESESGVQIPGFGAWILVALVIAIWAIIQFALLGPVEVARLAAEATIADAGEAS